MYLPLCIISRWLLPADIPEGISGKIPDRDLRVTVAPPAAPRLSNHRPAVRPRMCRSSSMVGSYQDRRREHRTRSIRRMRNG